MKLLLDVGNTRIKWAWWDGCALLEPGQILHLGQSADQTMAFLDGAARTPVAVIAANVAGEVMARALENAVRTRWRLSVDFARSRRELLGVHNGYADYRQLGVDRWLAIVAAYRHCEGPVCVVDAGTAVTVDQVNARGQHLGGVIVPGLELMRRSLERDTGDIRRLREPRPDGSEVTAQTVAGSTGEAVRLGSHLAITCLIERCMKTLRKDCGDASLVITGGDALALLAHFGETAQHRPLLVLEGLAAALA